MPEQAQQVLSQAQVNQALAVLREERRTHPYTTRSASFTTGFRLSFWGFWLSHLAIMVFALISKEAVGACRAARYQPEA